MNRVIHKSLSSAVVSAAMLTLASCNTDNWQEPAPNTPASVVVTQTGEAGGTWESSFTVSATVTGIDSYSRKITLTGPSGNATTFTAGSQVQNFDQLRVGDKVSATFKDQMVVFVRGHGEPPTVTHAAALARAPKGATPGAMVAESYEVTAIVKSIDNVNRTATLEFPSGPAITIPVRSDVDLGRYRVGDNVVTRVTTSLTLVVTKP